MTLTSAGVGVGVHLDGFTAAGLAAHRALVAAGTTAADLALVFAGVRHEDDDYAGVLSAVGRTIPRATVVGCSATGVLSSSEELEDSNAVAVLAIAGQQDLPSPIVPVFARGVRGDARAAGARLAREAERALGGDTAGAALALLVDPAQLDATDFVGAIVEVAPELAITGAGASGGESGCRVFWQGEAHPDAAVGLVIPRDLHPTLGMTQGCQAVGEALTITAAEGNLILEIDGRPPFEALQRAVSDPRHPGLRQMTPHLLAGIGELGADGRTDYVVRPFALTEGDRPALEVAEPVRAGQTIRFTVRDAIAARDDMKVMLDEQAEARAVASAPPLFGLYFNCAGRGSALYGQAGLDPELIRRRFGKLALAGVESSFEVAQACGRPRIHMFTGVLLLAG
jgi:small ligand-binding sensory domain FIST